MSDKAKQRLKATLDILGAAGVLIIGLNPLAPITWLLLLAMLACAISWPFRALYAWASGEPLPGFIDD